MAEIKKISDLPELVESTGNESVVGLDSNGAACKIPLDGIGGSVTPIILNGDSSALEKKTFAYKNNDQNSFDELYNTFIAGTPIIYVITTTNSQKSYAAKIISISKSAKEITIFLPAVNTTTPYVVQTLTLKSTVAS